MKLCADIHFPYHIRMQVRDVLLIDASSFLLVGSEACLDFVRLYPHPTLAFIHVDVVHINKARDRKSVV